MFEYVVKKNGLREDEARWFFQQLIVALDYCHKMVRGRGRVCVVVGAAGETHMRASTPQLEQQHS